MTFKKYIFSITIFAFLFSGCTNSPDILVKAGSGDQTITAKAGKTFSVSLEAQLSTGYSWKLMKLPSALKIVKEDVLTENKNADITGGFEIQQFVFKSIEKGELTLTFNYAQHWKDKPEITKITTVKVRIE